MNITGQMLKEYEEYLRDKERSGTTMEKYVRDVGKFSASLPKDKGIEEEMIREYKEWLRERYKIISANSTLVVVDNFFAFLGREEFKVKLYKIQRMTHSRPEREITERDHAGLVKAMRVDGDEWINMLLQTTRSTGTRTSELKFTTVDAVSVGKAEIYSKGKS